MAWKHPLKVRGKRPQGAIDRLVIYTHLSPTPLLSSFPRHRLINVALLIQDDAVGLIGSLFVAPLLLHVVSHLLDERLVRRTLTAPASAVRSYALIRFQNDVRAGGQILETSDQTDFLCHSLGESFHDSLRL